MTSNLDEDPDVLGFVSIALEMREQGIEPPLEEICKDRKDLIPAVERALRIIDKMPEMQAAAEGFDPLSGKVLAGRYRLEDKIGAGSMGYVYRGADDELGRPVAIKIMRTDLLGGPQAAARFLREAEALAAVQHKSVVAVHDRGETDDGLMFLVMELVEGVSLSELIRARVEESQNDRVRGTAWIAQHLDLGAPLEQTYVRQCVRWAEQLADGLGAAHGAGVIHRDVKPSNILIRRNGSAMLLDFGIAAMDAQATVSGGDRLVGTPAYMAPERLDHAPVSHSIDVYGLTATLYHALTLNPPYKGTSDEVLAELKRKDPPPARFYREDLPRDLEAILDVGLEREVPRRYGSARALREDLSALLDHRPVAARPVSAAGRVWRRVKRSREARVLVVLGVAALVFIAVRHWMMVQQNERKAAWLDTWAGVPPTLVFAPTSMRRIHDAEALELETARLDELVELSDSPVPSRVMRGAFRFDNGDRQGAREDMEVVSASMGSALARALATRYAEMQEDGGQISTVGLPPATGPEDTYLLAFHAVRNLRNHPGGLKAVLDALGDEKVRALSFACELGLLLGVETAVRAPSSERGNTYQSLLARAQRLEVSIGRSTSVTLYVAGASLLGLDHFLHAKEALEKAREMAPSDHAIRSNLARVNRGLKNPDEAFEELDYAVRLRPNSLHSHRELAKLLSEMGEFERSLQVVEAAPFRPTDEGRMKRHELRGTVFLRQARMKLNDRDACVHFAQLALTEFEQADRKEKLVQHSALFSRALIDEEPELVVELVFRELVESPLEWRWIVDAAALLPRSLEGRELMALRDFLMALANRLSHDARSWVRNTSSPPFKKPSNK